MQCKSSQQMPLFLGTRLASLKFATRPMLLALRAPVAMRSPTSLILTAALCVASESLPGYKTTYTVVTEGTGDKVVSKGSKVKVHATGIVHVCLSAPPQCSSMTARRRQPRQDSRGSGRRGPVWGVPSLARKTFAKSHGHGARPHPRPTPPLTTGDRQEVLEHQGQGPTAVRVLGWSGRRHHRMGSGVPWDEAGRGAQAQHPGGRGLRGEWLPGMGHSTQRWPRLRCVPPVQ